MTRKPSRKSITYTRDIDGATMVEVAPHQFVNAALTIASKLKAGEA